MWFYRTNIYYAYYTDYIKNFEYTRTIVEDQVSYTGEPSGNGISDVQHWVRYIPR